MRTTTSRRDRHTKPLVDLLQPPPVPVVATIEVAPVGVFLGPFVCVLAALGLSVVTDSWTTALPGGVQLALGIVAIVVAFAVGWLVVMVRARRRWLDQVGVEPAMSMCLAICEDGVVRLWPRRVVGAIRTPALLELWPSQIDLISVGSRSIDLHVVGLGTVRVEGPSAARPGPRADLLAAFARLRTPS